LIWKFLKQEDCKYKIYIRCEINKSYFSKVFFFKSLLPLEEILWIANSYISSYIKARFASSIFPKILWRIIPTYIHTYARNRIFIWYLTIKLCKKYTLYTHFDSLSKCNLKCCLSFTHRRSRLRQIFGSSGWWISNSWPLMLVCSVNINAQTDLNRLSEFFLKYSFQILKIFEKNATLLKSNLFILRRIHFLYLFPYIKLYY